MRLEKKKQLAARSLNVGSTRVIFNTQRLSEIKEAITKQDIKDLKNSGAILIREKKGRRKNKKRKIRRGVGSVRKKGKHEKEGLRSSNKKTKTLPIKTERAQQVIE